MPQLDFSIVFPQIFWLFIIFSLFYFMLIYFFFPFFIKTLRARRKILVKNIELLEQLHNKFNIKFKLLNNLFNKNVLTINNMLKFKIKPIFVLSNQTNFTFVDEKVAKLLYYNMLYYNENIFNLISINSNFLNLK